MSFNPKDITTKFQGYILKLVEDRFLNSKNAHFWEIAFKVRACTVISRIFKISKSNNFGLEQYFLIRSYIAENSISTFPRSSNPPGPLQCKLIALYTYNCCIFILLDVFNKHLRCRLSCNFHAKHSHWSNNIVC